MCLNALFDAVDGKPAYFLRRIGDQLPVLTRTLVFFYREVDITYSELRNVMICCWVAVSALNY